MSVETLSALLIWALALILSAVVWVRRRQQVNIAIHFAVNQAINLLPRIIVAMLAASFIIALVPPEIISSGVGIDSGLGGLVLAAGAGALVPGGPIIAIPLSVLLKSSGAGVPQIIAFISAWSIFAAHRIITYELTSVGWRFTLLRLTVGLPMPIIAGLLAYPLVT